MILDASKVVEPNKSHRRPGGMDYTMWNKDNIGKVIGYVKDGPKIGQSVTLLSLEGFKCDVQYEDGTIECDRFVNYVALQKKPLVFDHLGNLFLSVYEMCQYHEVDYQQFVVRTTKQGWNMKDALEFPGRPYRTKYNVDGWAPYNVRYFTSCEGKVFLKMECECGFKGIITPREAIEHIDSCPNCQKLKDMSLKYPDI